MALLPWGRSARLKEEMRVERPAFFEGHQFSLKGSPRHYDDVLEIIEATGKARVYFGEALTYERGAGVALWRVRAKEFDWLPPLYEWWANMERIEPIQFTFHLYLPDQLTWPALDLRTHPPDDVAAFIKDRAPWVTGEGRPSREKVTHH
jgi:hypothetical protein